MKKQMNVLIILLIFVSMSFATTVSMRDDAFENTKNATLNGATYTISFIDHNEILSDSNPVAIHYYYLKIENSGTNDKNVTIDLDNIKPGHTTLHENSSYQIYEINNLIEASDHYEVTYDDSSKNYEKKKYLRIKKNEVKEYVLIFETERFVSDEFNISFNTTDGIVFLDPVITSCGDIINPGVYTLQNSIYASSSPCIDILSDDVVFDGQSDLGYTVNDVGGGNVAFNIDNQDNITIIDTKVTDRIDFYNTNNVLLQNISWNTTDPGANMQVNNGENVTIMNCNGQHPTSNINIRASNINNIIIANNTIWQTGGSGGWAIGCEDCTNLEFYNNRIYNSGGRAVSLNNVDNSFIYNNTIENRTYWGFWVLGGSDNNQINDNIVCPLESFSSYYFTADSNNNTGSGNQGDIDDLDVNTGFYSAPCTPITIDITSPQETTYTSTNVPLIFTVYDSQTNYTCWKNLDGNETLLGDIVNNTPFEDTLSVGEGAHTVNVTCEWDDPLIEINTTDSKVIYHFNNNSAYGENDTHVYDFSGSGNNGTVQGDAHYNYTTKVLGNASMEFDETGDYVETPADDSYGGQNLTIIAWINRRSLGSDHLVVARRGGGSSNNFQIGVDSSDYLVFSTYGGCGGGSTDLYSSQLITVDTWFHTAFVLEHGVIKKIYINGTQDVNSTSVATIPTGCGNQATAVGANLRNPGTTSFDGFIDEVYIYNRTLSDEEILDNYNLASVVSYNDTASVDFDVSFELITNQTYEPLIDELTSETYLLNVSSSYDLDDINATLKWNGTEIIIPSETNGSFNTTEWWLFNATAFIPLVGANETVINSNWDYTVEYANTTIENFSTATFNQTVLVSYWVIDTQIQPEVLEGNSVEANVTTIKQSDLASVGMIFELNSVNYTATESPTDFWTADLVAPAVQEVVNNETVTLTPYLNLTYNSTNVIRAGLQNSTTVYKMVLTNCTGISTIPTLNFTFYDEETKDAMNASMEGTFNVVNSNITRNYSFTWTTNESASVCIYPIWANYSASSTQIYEAFGYDQRSYYLTNATLSNDTNNVSLYLLNASNAKLTVINVKTSAGANVEGAFIIIERYDVGTGIYTTVGVVKTGNAGNANTYLVPNDINYRFVVTSGNETQSFTPQTISCAPTADVCYVFLELGIGVYGNYRQYFTGVSGACTFENTTNILTCEATDTTGLVDMWKLKVSRMEIFNQSVICDLNDTSETTTLICYLGSNVSGNLYNYQFSALIDGDWLLLEDDPVLDFSVALQYGLLGTLLAYIVILTVCLLGSWHPAAMGFMGALAVGFVYVIGLVEMSWGMVGYFLIMALILMFKSKG